MATNLAQDDKNGVIQIVAGATHTAGTPIKTGTALFGVPQASVASGALSAIAVIGCYDLPKTGGVEAFAVGARVYWSGSVANSTATGDYIGVCTKAALIGATTVEVRINGEVGQFIPPASIEYAKHVAKSLATLNDGTAVIAAAEIVGGLAQCTPTASRAKATATAAAIIAALPGAVTGTSCQFSIANLSAAGDTITVTAGASVTLVGLATVASATSGTWTVLVTGATTVSMIRN
tara:strand:+ start:343 stop:1047 length:705 start_codon:yes stop_codon:yes gene_type:complete